MNIWFSADTHWGHAKLSLRRGFSTIEEHDKFLLETWNSTVKDNETVYFLGDLSFYNTTRTIELIQKINGQLHFLEGNHDAPLKAAINSGKLKRKVQDFKQTKMCSIDGQHIWLSHYAHRHWPEMHRKSWNAHGHSHSSLPTYEIGGINLKQLDVGVDCNPEKRPFNYDELKAIMDTRGLIKLDHHDPEDA